MRRNRIKDVLESLSTNGPLGTARRVLMHLHEPAKAIPGAAPAVTAMARGVFSLQQFLDASFDRRYGTDTSGVIAVKDLRIEKGSLALGNWYEPAGEKTFRQFIRELPVDPRDFVLVDYGSGKGRVLIMAAELGFKRVIGVEFARDLHEVAQKNIEIYERRTGRPNNIEVLCTDATEYMPPNEPLVLYFYSPFTGAVFRKVLDNISASFEANPRPVFIAFYGRNPESLEDLDAMGFDKRELRLKADWTRLTMYRGFIYAAPIGGKRVGIAAVAPPLRMPKLEP